ncbi:MAG: hypothetical protein ACXVNM_07965 [Bacteroidia bacterium]
MQEKIEELARAHSELILQYEEIKKCAKDLESANAELKAQVIEKEIRAVELEKMIFMTSHKVRKPIVQILGLANVLDDTIDKPVKLREIVNYIKESALELDALTKELTAFMTKIDDKNHSL